MSSSGKILRALAVLVITVGLGSLIGWLVSRQGDIAPANGAGPADSSLAIIPQAAPAKVAPVQSSMPKILDRVEPGAVHIADPPNGTLTEWEERLDTILLSDDNENGKADKILALIPKAPPSAQQELAQHLVNMVQDDHYDGTAQMLTNAATPADVSDVLMNDLLNRNNTLKLPMLLSIARNNDHPLKDQALDLLGLLTQADNGTNWDQWSSTISTWLTDNPQ